MCSVKYTFVGQSQTVSKFKENKLDLFGCNVKLYGPLTVKETLLTWRKKKSGDCWILSGNIMQWWCRKILLWLLFTWHFKTSFMWKEFTPPLKTLHKVFENIFTSHL